MHKVLFYKLGITMQSKLIDLFERYLLKDVSDFGENRL
jgi:hypothetical protein